MLNRRKYGRSWFAVLAIAGAGAMVGSQVPAAAADTPTIREQLTTIASSPAGINAEVQFAKFATSHDVASAANFLLSTQGNNLTGFQKSLLSLVPDIYQNSKTIQDVAEGNHLSLAENITLQRLRARFETNAAIRIIEVDGQKLKLSADLSGTVNSDTAALGNPITVIPSGSGIPQVDSFDNAAGNFATSADLPALSPALTAIFQDHSFADFVRQAPALPAASLIPAGQIWKLLLGHDHDPAVVDWVDYIGGVLSLAILGAAGIAGALGASAAAIVILTVAGTLIGIGTLTFHFLATIDCDHDGDPWDSADVAGNEC